LKANKKTVGVMGGMGPAATVAFMATIVNLTPADVDQDHVHTIVDNDPDVPARQDAILRGGPSPVPAMAAMARRLESAGADFLVMPCNTAHAYSAQIEAAVDIPLVSIITATVDRCRQFQSVSLLATEGCLRANVYQEALSDAGVELLLPTDDELQEFMRLTFEIKRANTSEAVSSGMLQLAESLLGRGAQALIAGCTEIPLVLNEAMLRAPLISSTDELAKKTIALALGQEPLAA
jgi:aspartate racemase